MDARARAKLDFWIEAAIVLIFCSLVAAWYIISSNRPLDSEDLSINAGDLRSFSASGFLLSDQSTNGDLTDTFFHEQLELLDDKVDDVRETFETSEVAPESKRDADQLKIFGNRLDITLERMLTENSPGRARELK